MSDDDEWKRNFEERKNQKNPQDLLTQSGLFNFLLNYIKDMKNDNLQIPVSEQTMSLLESFQASLTDWSKLDSDQLS